MTLSLRRMFALGLIASSLSLVTGFSAPSAAGSSPPSLQDCTTTAGAAPCIESVTVNSGAITTPFSYIAWYDDTNPSKNIYFFAQKDGTGGNLGFSALTDTWRVVIFVGNWEIPRVTHGKAQNVKVTRTHATDGYTVTISGNPVTVSGQCDSSGTYCPEDWVTGLPGGFNNRQWDGYFDFYITDYGAWNNASQRADFYGMNYFNNIAHTELPPQIVTPADPSIPPYLLVNAANRRFLQDGTTLVNGHAELRIPNQFLRDVYGVPDPASMTSSGVTVTGDGGATVDVFQEAGADAMIVHIDGMHFPNVSGSAPTPFAGPQSESSTTMLATTKKSLRHLKYKVGTITPTRPTNVHAKRVAAHRAKITFDRSRSRGAKVTGYLVRCVMRHGSAVVKVAGRNSPIVVKGLAAGRVYDCRVRAKSKAGPSHWSVRVKLRARP
jgi:hypothetical protein